MHEKLTIYLINCSFGHASIIRKRQSSSISNVFLIDTGTESPNFLFHFFCDMHMQKFTDLFFHYLKIKYMYISSNAGIMIRSIGLIAIQLD